MSQSDATVHEEDGKTRQWQEPIEDNTTIMRQVNEC